MKCILPFGEHTGVGITIIQILTDVFTIINDLLETSVRFCIIVLTLFQFLIFRRLKVMERLFSFLIK